MVGAVPDPTENSPIHPLDDILSMKAHYIFLQIPMAAPRIYFLLCLSLVALHVSADASSAHGELMKYGFPVGLLPANVESYTLNRTSGFFSVKLGESCRVTLPPDNYLATYSRKITGKLVENRIAELDGISVRAFFKWWGITGIRSNGQNLVFEVGVVTAKYPAKNFNQSPLCEGSNSSS